jgi:hypothetical protein
MILTRGTWRSLFALFALAPIAACSNNGTGSPVRLPSFSDVSSAPPAIQTAAAAVVRISTAGELATGSFISPTGLLLTNNHVLGVDICPLEGCFANITFMYQRGSPAQQPQTVFVVPVAVDVGLDMAVMQAYPQPGAAPLETPNYLTIDARDPSSLLGTHVHVIGHPEGHLKKWSQGEVVDSDGTWIWFSAYSLPGNSGSPVLDDAGHVVGLLHRGPTAQDLVSGSGIAEYAIGTASSAVTGAMNAPLPPAMRSVATSTTDADVALHHLLYLNAHVPNAIVGGVSSPVLSSLATACDAGLAQMAYESPDDMSSALAPCSSAELWIDCRSDVMSAFAQCPEDGSGWGTRYQSVYEHWQALNGELALDMVSFAPAALTQSRAAGIASGAALLQQALTAAQAPLDFAVANYLAAFQVGSYDGTRLLDFVHGYARFPDYTLSGTAIAATALWLADDGEIDRADIISFLKALAGDGGIDLGSKLYIEDVLYRAGELD